MTVVGTGADTTAVDDVLKKDCADLKVFAVEPTLSAVISGGQPGPHPIQGLAAGFIPTNLHTDVLNGVITVEADESKEMARRAAREERTEERRGGKEWVSTCRSRWSPYH